MVRPSHSLDRTDGDRRERLGWRRQGHVACRRGPSRRTDANAVAAEPARARLVHLLSCRRPDRVRAVHRGLSDHGKMDPGADRPRAVDRRRGRTDRADARRRHHRRGPVRTAGRGACDCDHRLQRARLCGLADLSRRGGGGDVACGRKLRARPGDRRDQPRPGRAARDRRTARAQRPLRVARQRRRRGRHGHLRLSCSPAARCFSSPSFSRSRPCWRSRSIREREIDVAYAHGAVPRESPTPRPPAWSAWCVGGYC